MGKRGTPFFICRQKCRKGDVVKEVILIVHGEQYFICVRVMFVIQIFGDGAGYGVTDNLQIASLENLSIATSS